MFRCQEKVGFPTEVDQVPGVIVQAGAGLKNGQFNHREIVPFWLNFIREVKAPLKDEKTGRQII